LAPAFFRADFFSYCHHFGDTFFQFHLIYCQHNGASGKKPLVKTRRVTMKQAIQTMAVVLAMAVAAPVMADTPASLKGPHGHGENAVGKITLYRAQSKGIEIGSGFDKLDAEVLVVLDSKPDLVLGIAYHDIEPASETMISTLRDAYIHNLPVTIQYVKAPGKKNLRINWVQLGE
jgi:hypothetical protein